MAKDKQSTESELKQVRSNIIALDGLIAKAEAAGDENARSSLLGDLATLDAYAKTLEADFSGFQEQEREAKAQTQADLEKRLKLATPTETAVQPEQVFKSFTPVGPMGGMLNVATIVPPPPTESQKEESRRLAGELLNAPVGEGGRKAEMLPAGLRAQLGSLPTPESKAQLLQKNFPGADIAPLNVRGDTEFLIKLPSGEIKTTFESGIAGMAGAAAVEVPITAAETVAGLTTLATTKSPFTALTASSATRLGLGTGIDEALRLAYGIDQDFGGSLGRRGIEAGTQFALGGLTDVAIPSYLASRISSPFENQFAKNLESAAANLTKREAALAAKQGRAAAKIEVPTGAKVAGPAGLLAQKELAGEFPRSGIAASARKTQETALRLFRDFTSDVPSTPNDFSTIAANRVQQRDALAKSIAGTTKSNERVIQEAISRQFVGKESNKDALGEALRESVGKAEQQAMADVRALYDDVFDLADQGGFKTSPEEMLDIVSEIKNRVNPSGSMSEAAISAVENRLRMRANAPEMLDAALKRFDENPTSELRREIDRLTKLSKPMGSRDFDDFIKEFNNARPENAVGGTTKDVFGMRISQELSKYRKQVYDNIDTQLPSGETVNIGSVFDDITQKVKERGAFEKNLLGNILREAGGEQATTPRNIVNAVMREPATVNRVTAALRQLGQSNPEMIGEADRILGLMQKQYLNNIGIGSVGIKPKTSVQFDRGMLESLFGKEAGQVQRSLEAINQNIRGFKSSDASKLTYDDIKQLGGALSEDERKKVAKNIFKRLELEKEQEILLNSQLFNLAKEGDFKNIDPDLLSKAILSEGSTISQVKSSMSQLSKMSPESRNLYKGDFIRELLDRFPGGEPTANAPFVPLFDAQKFISAYESPGKTGKTQFAAKLETVLGREDARFLYDLAKIYDANTIIDFAKRPDARVMAGSQGISVYLTTGLASKGRNRLLAAMLSSGSKRQGLKNALSRNALPGAVNEAYNKMFKEAFLTRTGITALANQASQDPEFSAELTNMLKEFRQKQGLDVPEFIPKGISNE